MQQQKALNFHTLQSLHTSHQTVLSDIVGGVLGRNFKYSGEELGVVIKYVSDFVGDILCDKNDGNIIAGNERLERSFNVLLLGSGIYNEEIGVSLLTEITNTSEEKTGDSILISNYGKNVTTLLLLYPQLSSLHFTFLNN